ncbi:MAG: hypothetical protein ACOCXQ_03690 [Patescibacteria group bacterium]
MAKKTSKEDTAWALELREAIKNQNTPRGKRVFVCCNNQHNVCITDASARVITHEGNGVSESGPVIVTLCNSSTQVICTFILNPHERVNLKDKVNTGINNVSNIILETEHHASIFVA